MYDDEYKVGLVVLHQEKPQWGYGIIVKICHDNISVRFRQINEVKEFDRKKVRLKIFPDKYGKTPMKARTFIKGTNEELSFFEKESSLVKVSKIQSSTLPRTSGVYGWYFDDLPPYVPIDDCQILTIKDGWFFKSYYCLAYIGKAKNLRDRIYNYHIKGMHYAQGALSSLRLTLGCLFSNKWGYYLEFDPEESFSVKGDKCLSEWLKEHAMIKWVETDYIDETEKQLIEYYTLPLNTAENDHPFSRKLESPLYNLRNSYKNISRSPKPKKKLFKKAYNEFKQECKVLGYKK